MKVYFYSKESSPERVSNFGDFVRDYIMTKEWMDL